MAGMGDRHLTHPRCQLVIEGPGIAASLENNCIGEVQMVVHPSWQVTITDQLRWFQDGLALINGNPNQVVFVDI